MTSLWSSETYEPSHLALQHKALPTSTVAVIRTHYISIYRMTLPSSAYFVVSNFRTSFVTRHSFRFLHNLKRLLLVNVYCISGLSISSVLIRPNNETTMRFVFLATCSQLQRNSDQQTDTRSFALSIPALIWKRPPVFVKNNK